MKAICILVAGSMFGLAAFTDQAPPAATVPVSTVAVVQPPRVDDTQSLRLRIEELIRENADLRRQVAEQKKQIAELAAAKESAARPKAVPVLAAKPSAYYTTRSSSGCAGGSCSSRGTARRGPFGRRR